MPIKKQVKKTKKNIEKKLSNQLNPLSYDSSELLLSKIKIFQKKDGYLSEQNAIKLAKKFKKTPTNIYEVASFYSFVNTKAKGKNIIRVCHSPTCYINGSDNILLILKKLLGISPGETTKDNKFSLEFTSCIGCCNKSPAALINNKPYTELNEKKIKEIIDKLKKSEKK